MRSLRAVIVLSLDLLRRFVREGIVLRSLVFPIVLAAGSMVLTVAAVVMVKATPTVALTDTVDDPAIIARIEEGGWPILRVEDPEVWVEDGRALVGTDGAHIWMHRSSSDALALESILREHLGASWRPATRTNRFRGNNGASGGRILLQFIGGLFAFYGVVFGAGSVARDRDQGTLEAELAMPVPTWVHGFARWLAGSLLLTVFFALAIAVFDALLGLEAPSVLMMHGTAACAGSVALGLIVIGRSGLEAGFAAPMSAGLVAVVSLLSLGVGNHTVGAWIPVASLLARSQDGLTPLLVSLTWGVAATLVFTFRSARA